MDACCKFCIRSSILWINSVPLINIIQNWAAHAPGFPVVKVAPDENIRRVNDYNLENPQKPKKLKFYPFKIQIISKIGEK